METEGRQKGDIRETRGNKRETKGRRKGVTWETKGGRRETERQRETKGDNAKRH